MAGEWLNRVHSDSVRLVLAELVHVYMPKALHLLDGHGDGGSDAAPTGGTARAGEDPDPTSDVCGQAEWASQDGFRSHGLSALARVHAVLRTLEAVLRCEGHEVMREFLSDGGPGEVRGVDCSLGSQDASSTPYGVVRDTALVQLSSAQIRGLSKYFLFALAWGLGGHLNATGGCLRVCVCVRARACVCGEPSRLVAG